MGLSPKASSLEKQGAMVFTSLHDWHSTKRWLLSWAADTSHGYHAGLGTEEIGKNILFPGSPWKKWDFTLSHVLPESKATNPCALGSDRFSQVPERLCGHVFCLFLWLIQTPLKLSLQLFPWRSLFIYLLPQLYSCHPRSRLPTYLAL